MKWTRKLSSQKGRANKLKTLTGRASKLSTQMNKVSKPKYPGKSSFIPTKSKLYTWIGRASELQS